MGGFILRKRRFYQRVLRAFGGCTEFSGKMPLGSANPMKETFESAFLHTGWTVLKFSHIDIYYQIYYNKLKYMAGKDACETGGRTMEKEISQAVVRRMPRYYRYLGELLDDGVERISSNELSTRMRVTASQIRQDLNNFGGFGQQGYGYNVKYLYDEIGKILGINHQHNIIVVGAGNLGQALANYIKFEKRGFVIIGLFDVNPALRGIAVRGIKIRTMDELKDFLAENQVDIAALTLPKEKADEVANMLVNLGINAIWNFAHLDLELPEHVVVENVHLSDSLMQLSYNIARQRKSRDKK